MLADVTDTTFAIFLSSGSESGETTIDLTGTLFTFENGLKIITTKENSIKIQVDNDALLPKYQFIYDYAPRMWLSEKDDGWWPGTHQEFFDNMKGE